MEMPNGYKTLEEMLILFKPTDELKWMKLTFKEARVAISLMKEMAEIIEYYEVHRDLAATSGKRAQDFMNKFKKWKSDVKIPESLRRHVSTMRGIE